ncbi:hypothetical protein EDD90_10305 [Streptomyces sp. Ag109_O5-1]|nr:hypothetical protein EDD90_10305 [Streptomyces sp. Ag109_O5-1]
MRYPARLIPRPWRRARPCGFTACGHRDEHARVVGAVGVRRPTFLGLSQAEVPHSPASASGTIGDPQFCKGATGVRDMNDVHHVLVVSGALSGTAVRHRWP